MALKYITTITIPGAEGSAFDHGAFDPKTRRVFVAHTSRDRVAVIDHDSGEHLASLEGFPQAAGVVADDGMVLVTNRGAAGLAWVDAASLKTRVVFDTGPRPNGVAIVAKQQFGIAACIGDDQHSPVLLTQHLTGKQHRLDLPGQPRWCVTDATGTRVYLAIREPSMVLVTRLPDLGDVQHWRVSVSGTHGLEIDHRRNRLYVACDDKALVEMDTTSGEVINQWPLAGPPDVTFVNPATGLVHVAIGDPGVVQSIDPRTGANTQLVTARGAHTTAIIPPDRLYVFAPSKGGAIVLEDS
jgi:DNA-binding beta-propeller fold protein YncE